MIRHATLDSQLAVVCRIVDIAKSRKLLTEYNVSCGTSSKKNRRTETSLSEGTSQEEHRGYTDTATDQQWTLDALYTKGIAQRNKQIQLCAVCKPCKDGGPLPNSPDK